MATISADRRKPAGVTGFAVSRRRAVQAVVLLAAGLVLLAPADLSLQARLAFVVFGVAIYGWVATSLNEAWVALGAALTFALVGADEPDAFFNSLGDPTIWLLLGAFVLAAAAQASGLARRLGVMVIVRARSVRGLFAGLTAAITLTAFVIPSTSGRAALLIPVFLALAAAIDDKRIVRALALLFPTVILLSAVASLVGAGAHLVTAEILEQTGNETISYGRWLLLGAPFALVSAFGSSWVIQRLFLNREERLRPLAVAAADLRDSEDPDAPTGTGRLTRAERTVLAVTAVLVALWCTESLHGIDAAFVALAGALAVTMPRLGVIGFKSALKQVDFGILVFLAATLVLGRALIDSGAADWLVTQAFGVVGGASAPVLVGVVAALSLLAHLIITSRTARSSVLVPLVILLGASAGVNPALLAFVSTAAAGFCLTLPVSAKPVMLFSGLERPTFEPGDLLRLSRVLLPAHLAGLLLFAFTVWPALGLSATGAPATAPSGGGSGSGAPGPELPSAPTWASPEERAQTRERAERNRATAQRDRRESARVAELRALRGDAGTLAERLSQARGDRDRARQRARRLERELERLRNSRRSSPRRSSPAPGRPPAAPPARTPAPSSDDDGDGDDD